MIYFTTARAGLGRLLLVGALFTLGVPIALAQDAFSPTPVPLTIPDAPAPEAFDAAEAVGLPAGPAGRSVNPEWSWQHPSLSADYVQAVEYATESVVYAAASLGTVLRSDDAGQTWQKLDTGFDAALTGMAVFSADEVIVVGSAGFVASTVDGGASWTQHDAGTTQNLRGVGGTGLGDVYVTGDTRTVLRSTDGGTTWADAAPSDNDVFNPNSRPNWAYRDLVVTDDGTLLLALDGTGMPIQVLSSTDQGQSWTTAVASGLNTPGGSTGLGVTAIAVTSGSTAYAAYRSGLAGGLIRTDDGGENWSLVSNLGSFTPLPSSVPYSSQTIQIRYGVGVSPDGQTIVTGGLFGQVLASGDGGATWAEVYGGVRQGDRDFFSAGFQGAAVSPGGSEWLVGGSWGMIVGTDGVEPGAATLRNGIDLPITLRDVAFIDDNHGFAVGFQDAQRFTSSSGDIAALAVGAYYVTTDGGQTWTRQEGPGVTNVRWSGIEATADGRLWTAGLKLVGTSTLGTIHYSDDAGASWTEVGDAPQEIASLTRWDDEHLYAVTFGTHLVRTADGMTWETVDVPVPNAGSNGLSDVTAIAPDVLVAVSSTPTTGSGNSAAILISLDRGDSWDPAYVTSSAGVFTTVHFFDGQVGYVAGRYGGFGSSRAFLVTHDGGRTWAEATAPQPITTMFATSRTDAVAFGSNNVAIETTDGGTTWTDATPGITTQNMQGAFVRDANEVWVVGTAASVMAYTAATPAPTAPGRLAGTAPALGATVSATAATTFAWSASDGATAYTLVFTDEEGEETRLVAGSSTSLAVTPASAGLAEGDYDWHVEATGDGDALRASFALPVTIEPGAAEFAQVQVIHNAPDPAVASVDVYVDGQRAVEALAFRTATAYTEVEAGAPVSVALAPAGSDSVADAVYTATLTLDAGVSYQLVAQGVLDGDFTPNPDGLPIALEVLALDGVQTEAEDGLVQARLVHGTPDAPAVDVTSEDGSFVFAEDVAYGSASAYTAFTADEAVVVVRQANGGSELARFAGDFAAFDGTAVTVLASGFAAPEAQDDSAGEPAGFALVVVTADGETLVIEPMPPSSTPETDASGDLRVAAAYPNPFAERTTITVDLPVDATLHVEVIDVLGRRVIERPAEVRSAGNGQTLQLEAGALAPGTYLVRVVAETATGRSTHVQRVTVVR